MKYDPQKQHRRSIRLDGFDYSQTASYFVTLVSYQRAMLFGEISGGEVQLNTTGKIVQSAWLALPDRFPTVELDEFVIMPNHIHAIITVGASVGATLVVARESRVEQNRRAGTSPAPTIPTSTMGDQNAGVGATLVVALESNVDQNRRAGTSPAPTIPPSSMGDQNAGVGATLVVALEPMVDQNRRAGTSPAPTDTTAVQLGDVIGAFKSITTHDIILAVRRGDLPPFAGKIWQRNYYEHIIRSEQEWERIGQYICDNPVRWAEDAENPASKQEAKVVLKELADILVDGKFIESDK